jgi:hypothetical protein
LSFSECGLGMSTIISNGSRLSYIHCSRILAATRLAGLPKAKSAGCGDDGSDGFLLYGIVRFSQGPIGQLSRNRVSLQLLSTVRFAGDNPWSQHLSNIKRG